MLRIYKYEPKQVFGAHYDQSMMVGGHCTEYTLLVYLSGELQGGETVFYGNRGTLPSPMACTVFPNPGAPASTRPRLRLGSSAGAVVAAVEPQAGMALLHRHGAACLLHEARPVVKGVKYVLRSDVVFS